MTEDTTFDTNVKVLYDDPLINVTTFTDAKQREQCVEGDRLLNPYISKLDEEIFSDTPLFTPSGSEHWEEDALKDMAVQLVDKARINGWAIVQFYNKGPKWRVFSDRDKSCWIRDEKKNIIGVKVQYGDVTDEECIFGKKQCYLLKFKEGNNKDVFAYSDLDQAMWTVATTTREIQTQLDMMARKPEFYHVVYGNPTPTQRTAIMNALDDASVLNAFAATEAAVKEIKIITRGSFTPLQESIAEKTKHFAGLTRLPLAFYNGERTSGSGTGGSAENMVEIKIGRRKEHIFNIIKPLIIQIYADRYNITLTDVQIEVEKPVENVNKNNDEPLGNELNGQKNQGLHSSEKID